MSVVVLGAVWGVWAADNKNVPVGQAVRGALVAKTATAVDVRAEDEQEVRRYVVVPPACMPRTRAALTMSR